MFNPHLKNEIEAKQAEYMRIAEQSRQIAEARQGRRSARAASITAADANAAERLYGPLLASVGDRMIEWGEALHRRYGQMEFPEVAGDTRRLAADDCGC
jgi:hypothetical protein